ncbi:ABC transporter ATP-binding protein [Prosthecodimorpha hirschii]|uniref:ABC transporter ATP-binding protein n=1 Tax=Prosthecodimorpha hirschii TaxID=665126 RepID=UPI001AEEA83D|nr:ABC transporter ATP-binding protein [Prosthecomicrobium hirschii]
MAGAAIRIEGLSKRYGDFVAVDNVSLDIAPGEFVTLLGLSGSGKTTTLMAVAGFVEPDAGRIAIDGRDIVDLPPEKRNLGVVFQSYALFPHLNVFENVAFPLRMRKRPAGEIEAEVKRLLGTVHLEAFADRKIAALSGGQQQRVALARALVFAPPVLLMDEPLGALDRSLRDELQTEIKRIQRDLGVTVIYVTHDQEEALALSDRIAVMAGGTICQLATPDEIYERPRNAFVASFVGESNAFDVRMAGPAVAGCQPVEIGGLAFTAIRQEDISGERGLMVIRPEAITLAGAPAPAGNVIAGRIVAREFLGATIRLSIVTALGTFLVRQPRTAPAARAGLGETVHLSWNAADALLFAPRP